MAAVSEICTKTSNPLAACPLSRGQSVPPLIANILTASSAAPITQKLQIYALRTVQTCASFELHACAAAIQAPHPSLHTPSSGKIKVVMPSAKPAAFTQQPLLFGPKIYNMAVPSLPIHLLITYFLRPTMRSLFNVPSESQQPMESRCFSQNILKSACKI